MVGTEPTDNITTWVFEEGTFVPTAKLTGEENLSIVTDHLGTPVEMYDKYGIKVWELGLDIYGKNRKFEGNKYAPEPTSCPFRYQGQYEDWETGLYYNRFRYYSPDMGMYLSQDPIGLAGNNPTLYGYVFNTNLELDVLGLAGNPATATHITYLGVDATTGKPYVGYASMQGTHIGTEVLDYRYNSNYGRFQSQPTVVYARYGIEGKQTARGLEQRIFEQKGGLSGTANLQNPVGLGNTNREIYLDKADEYLRKSKTPCGG